MDSKSTFEFRSVTEAIRVLRSGKKDARWYDAAEFLISRATPEVTMMIEVGQALAKREQAMQEAENKQKSPWRWILLAVGLVFAAIVMGYGFGKLFGLSCS